jgi:hypothetical protein
VGRSISSRSTSTHVTSLSRSAKLLPTTSRVDGDTQFDRDQRRQSLIVTLARVSVRRRAVRTGLQSEMNEPLVGPFPIDEGFFCPRPLRSRSSRLRLESRLLRRVSGLQLRNLFVDLGHPILELF